MKTSTVPILCGIALAAMSAAGLSHWWSVKQFVAALEAGTPFSLTPGSPARPAGAPAAPEKSSAPVLAAKSAKSSLPASDDAQKNFYEELVAKMQNLQNQNRDLLDQMAETNRDVMKLEFRVDTHSESFRPMPVNDERLDTSFDNGPGVLPPRAEPVFPPFEE